MTKPLLEISGLCVEGWTPLGRWVPTVRDASVAVHRGEVVALIGGSGAGKTTVALTALGYARPGTRIVGGSVELEGVDMLACDQRTRRDLRGREVAYVAQSAQSALNPAISIGDQVAEPLILHGLATRAEARRRAIDMLALLDLPNPAGLVDRYPHQASGGQQQRIIAAMALICMPKLLVLDEPTTALDVTTQIEVLKAIKDVIRERRTAAIYVSHDLAVVAQIADRIIVMKDGAVLEAGSTADIVERPSTPYTCQLIGAIRHHGTVGAALPAQKAEAPRPLIQIDAVSCTYERPPLFGRLGIEADVLHEVTIDVRPREVVAVVGESGSGKSTLARLVAGLHPQRSGQVRLDGGLLASEVRRRSHEELRRIQIIFQSQDLSLNPEQRIEEAIGRPLRLYFGLKGKRLSARVAELLETVGLPADFARRYPAELSGGQRQRVSIARAFAAKPDLVLCDEILSALDTIVAAQILELMRRLRADSDVAYMFISHDLATVSAIADRVVVLYAGRVCEIGPVRSVFNPPHHPYSALLLSSVPMLRQGWLEDVLEGHVPTQAQTGGIAPKDAGCPFRTRCPLVMPEVCATVPPPALQLTAGHTIFCHHDAATLHAAQSGETVVAHREALA